MLPFAEGMPGSQRLHIERSGNTKQGEGPCCASHLHDSRLYGKADADLRFRCVTLKRSRARSAAFLRHGVTRRTYSFSTHDIWPAHPRKGSFRS